MRCSQEAELEQRLDNALEEYRKAEVELRAACHVYVETGQVRFSPPRAGSYRAWSEASRALDRHLSTHQC